MTKEQAMRAVIESAQELLGEISIASDVEQNVENAAQDLAVALHTYEAMENA